MTLGDNIPSWNLACIAAVVGIVGCVAFDLYGPKPTLGKQRAKLAAESQKLVADQAKGQQALLDDTRLEAERAWDVPVANIGPAVLDKVNDLAKQKGIKVSTFRPQRVQPVTPLQAAEFTISVQGPYLQILSFVHSLEQADTKIVVSMAMLSSSDADSSAVSATIGLVAFVKDQEKQVTSQKLNNG